MTAVSTSSIPRRFGDKWERYTKILPEHGAQFEKWIAPWKPSDFSGQKVLDAGCGIGTNSLQILRAGARTVTAFDADPRTVDIAVRNLAAFPNVLVVQRSIYDIEWEGEFDIAVSIGVIHHLENPLAGVKKLAASIRPGGRVLIWVYGYEGNEWIDSFVSPLRRLILARLPSPLLHLLTYLVSLPFYVFIRIVPQHHPYLRQLRQFRFSHVHSIIYDQLLPPISNYYRQEEARRLLIDAGLENVFSHHCNENSWTVTGVKP